jgi:tetratricopeptide (TPR) repeat protein
VLAGEAFLEQGEFQMADMALGMALEGAGLLGDRALQTTARLVQLQLHFLIEGKGSEEELIEEVEQAVPVLQKLGYHEDLARAWRLAFLVYGTALRWSAAEQAAQRMIEHARLAGDDLMETRLLTDLAMCALYGPMPVPEAIERCRALLERASRDRKAEAITLAVLAELEAMRRNFDEARALYRRSRAGLEELGWKFHAALTSIHSAPVELLAGDPMGAESELRHDFDALESMRERNYISTTAGFLAEALYQQDRFEEADSFVQISKEIAAPNDLSSQLLWRGVSGKILARTGMLEESDRLVREAVQLMQGSEEPVSQGYALMDLAEVLRLAGREDDAAVAIKEAIELFDEKGNLVAAERARELLVHSETPSLEQPPG